MHLTQILWYVNFTWGITCVFLFFGNEVIFITIRNITMTFLCKFILIQTNNCEYEVLNVKCQFCFYRKLPNNWSFFLLLCVFYDSFQTKLKKIVTYRGVSNSSLNDFFRRGYLGFVFVHLAPPPSPPLPKKKIKLWIRKKRKRFVNSYDCLQKSLKNVIYSAVF